MDTYPSVSIIINTDGRASSLRNTVQSLRYLRFPNFEIVVVAGPTADGTHELIESWKGEIKIGHCPQRNLSQSRNIGIEISAGDVLAFIDDDAVAEPEWLDDVVPAFLDPQVGGAGGFVHNHTGKGYQWRFGTTDRFGITRELWDRATPEFNFPLSFNFPALLGTNSLFRRSALLEIGGFDEEFDYYLDETDVICRLIDRGWHIAQLDCGFIHHKFLPSDIRNGTRTLSSWYSVVKNKTYFSLINGALHAETDQAMSAMQRFVADLRGQVADAIDDERLLPEDRLRFEREAEQGLSDGLARGSSGLRRLPDRDRFNNRQNLAAFRGRMGPDEQRCFVLLSESYPPEPESEIGRYTHRLAQRLAATGHQVHVLTRGAGHDRVDFEDGVWVHRCVIKSIRRPEAGPWAGKTISAALWNYSVTMLDEAKEIAFRRPIDCVHAPIWLSEPVAFLRDGSFPVVTGIYGSSQAPRVEHLEPRAGDEAMRIVIPPAAPADTEVASHYRQARDNLRQIYGAMPTDTILLETGGGTSILVIEPSRITERAVDRATTLRGYRKFIRLLAAVDRGVPLGGDIHVLSDNAALCEHPRVRAWLGRHRRFSIHPNSTLGA